MANNRKHIWTIAFGILTACVILISQFLCLFESNLSDGCTKTEQHEPGETSDKVIISVSPSSLPSHSTVEVHHEICCLFEVVFGVDNAKLLDFNIALPFDNLLRTLFEVIISPNAP